MHDKLDTWSRWEWGVNSDGPLIWPAGRYLSILQWTELSEASSNRNIDQLSHAEHKQMLRIIYWNFSLDQIITRWVFSWLFMQFKFSSVYCYFIVDHSNPYVVCIILALILELFSDTFMYLFKMVDSGFDQDDLMDRQSG